VRAQKKKKLSSTCAGGGAGGGGGGIRARLGEEAAPPAEISCVRTARFLRFWAESCRSALAPAWEVRSGRLVKSDSLEMKNLTFFFFSVPFLVATGR
jgi:hypothetical protein